MKKISLVIVLVLVSFSAHAKKIGILSALPLEQEDLKAFIVDGKIGEHEVFLSLSGVGKVNAAASAQKMISEQKVDVIIFSGVAGGINKDYNIGDVILVSQSFQHDVGFHGDTFVIHPAGLFPEFGTATGKEPLFTDLSSTTQFKAAAILAKKFVKKLTPVTVDDKKYQPKIYLKGTVATGDQFIANEDKKNALRSLGADLVEMEGAAVVQVASQSKVPCLIIRSISDKAGTKAVVDFKNLFAAVAKNNSNLVEFILKNSKL
jgi:adenosylhomocysteine nucleosidase